MKPGRESSEYTKSLRAEVIGIALVVLGVFLVFFGPSAEAAAALIAGAYIVGQTARGYAESRGRAKGRGDTQVHLPPVSVHAPPAKRF